MQGTWLSSESTHFGATCIEESQAARTKKKLRRATCCKLAIVLSPLLLIKLERVREAVLDEGERQTGRHVK